MVLLNNIVEVFHLAYRDQQDTTRVDVVDCRLVSAALVHGDLVRHAARGHCLVEEAPCCSHVALGRKQKVYSLALLVDDPVEVFPRALDLNVRLVHTPAAADWTLVLPSRFLDQR